MKKCLIYIFCAIALLIIIIGGLYYFEHKRSEPVQSSISGTAGEINWTIKDGILTISGEGHLEGGDGAMGDTPWLKDIQSKEEWSERRDSIQSVIVEDGITSLPYAAFAYYTNLADVVLGDGIIEIGTDTFLGCKKLKNIEFGNNLEIIVSGAFEGCSELTDITIPDTVTKIGEDAFKDCEKIVMHVTAGSYAETYANKYNVSYIVK